MTETTPRTNHVISFIDIGTNSIRMLIVRLNPNFSYTVISQEKEVVRLGEREFADNQLQPEAIGRAVLVCKKFAELSRTYGADEIIAVATSAAREARNQSTLIDRLRDEAGIDVGIISGMEEARLVYLGVSSGVELSTRNALFIDIGGGSTELAIGDRTEYTYLDSFKLGAIRLTSIFIKEGFKGPIDQETYSRMRKHVKTLTVHSVQSVRKSKIELAIGSSGTIINLAEIAARAYGSGGKPQSLKYSNLKKLTQLLCSLPLEERRKVPGINPERADIIIGGACILETLMDELKVDEIQVSDRGVRDGLLVDYLSKIEGYPHAQRMSVRETSVLQLGRSCNIDERHSETVVRIALLLFDSARAVDLHPYGQKERELLKFAAYLHDIGDFISFTNHQAHSYYIIRNADLLGFDEREIAIMANLTRYHRKRAPKKHDPELDELDDKSQQIVIMLASLLRLAESLDRSHASLVQSVQFLKADKEKAVLEVTSDKDVQLEVWGVEGDAKAFERSYGRDLLVKVRRSGEITGII